MWHSEAQRSCSDYNDFELRKKVKVYSGRRNLNKYIDIFNEPVSDNISNRG